MKLDGLPIGAVDWRRVPAVRHAGETGAATARTRDLGGVQLRIVEYGAGYRADHWCPKGPHRPHARGRARDRAQGRSPLPALGRHDLARPRRCRPAAPGRVRGRRDRIHRGLTGCFPRARCGAKRCGADPGPTFLAVLGSATHRSASLRAASHAGASLRTRLSPLRPLAKYSRAPRGLVPRPRLPGEVAERLNAPHSKCGIRVTVSGVRIPPSPPKPLILLSFLELFRSDP
jgi:hypothetical protein